MSSAKNNPSLEHIRHSLAHLLAAAVLEQFPDAKLGIGPAIDTGFYYDIQFTTPLSPDDLPKLESRMRELIQANLPFAGKTVSLEEAKAALANQPFKHELIDELAAKGETLTLYTTGDVFTDLCRGGHVENTGQIPTDAFKLDKLAGAYWHGDEKNAQLTRIYGLAFESKEKLDEYITQQEEAKKRDHRKLGKELELYTIIDEIGPGLPLFYPKGALLRRTIENYITELQESKGYVPIWIPHITKGKLYEISGHLEKYDAMYSPMKVDEDDYYLKPMNCPHFMMLFKTLPHSYKELPLRYTSTTTNYRYEKSGELSGLTRVRSLTQDDCHVFCTPEQIEAEISTMTSMIGEIYKTFNLTDFWVRISLRDSQNKSAYLGDDAVWNRAENALREVVKKTGWPSEEAEGEAAFYGPKLDFIFKDVLGREWQLSTIQLDFNLPKRFELEYTNSEGKKTEPVVIHRAMLGSTERFMGIMIEHFGGIFPTWLAPVQVAIIPVGEKFNDYAGSVEKMLRTQNVRVQMFEATDPLGKRIRAAKEQKIPYMIVVGEKEQTSGNVAPQHFTRGQLPEISVAQFVDEITTEIKNRSL